MLPRSAVPGSERLAQESHSSDGFPGYRGGRVHRSPAVNPMPPLSNTGCTLSCHGMRPALPPVGPGFEGQTGHSGAPAPTVQAVHAPAVRVHIPCTVARELPGNRR